MISSAVRRHVSNAYNSTFHTNTLTIIFFKLLLRELFKSSCFLLTAFFAIAIQMQILNTIDCKLKYCLDTKKYLVLIYNTVKDIIV